MLKSLFFKPKANSDELLPPPPPFPSMELEEEKPAIAKEETQVSEELFDDLFSELETKPAKEPKTKKGKSEPEEPELSDSLLDELFKDATTEPTKKQAKGKKIKGKKTKPGKDFFKKLGIESIKPEKISTEDITFPDTLEDLNNLDIDSELKKFKGDEAQLSPDAEKEIMEAIGEAKGRKKSGFLSGIRQKLMTTREKRLETEAKVYDNISQPAAFASDLEKIQGKIGEARAALMDFNLNKAKSLYLEIISTYNSMKPEDKGKVYNDISDLYAERKSAEQLKV